GMQRDIALHHDRIGGVLAAQGKAAGALAEYQAALVIDQVLAAKDPMDAELQHSLAADHDRLGDVLSAQGNAAGALVDYRESLAITETLAAKDPTNADRQR